MLSKALDVGNSLREGGATDGADTLGREVALAIEQSPQIGNEAAVQTIETAVLDAVGHDLLVCLAAFSFATPLAQAVKVTPILVYLVFGALLGPHGLGILQSSQADVELGDFGILFLLFAEGLQVTSDRLKELVFYLPLGLAQVAITTGILTYAWLGPAMHTIERLIPLDGAMLDITNPIEAVVLALAGSLSTSAFIFPVLKERGWEDRASGQAATSILLLQDLLVAPLLVLLPFVVGQGLTESSAVIGLTLKATLGFGAVLTIGSYLLNLFFEAVARVRSADTFVALSLLVALGMGVVAKSLGLTDTAGAFAAGVLLANTDYKFEISAAVGPFKGILLGCFFLTAGSNFDTNILLQEWPTITTGVTTLILLKALTLGAAARLDQSIPTVTYIPTADIVRLSVLLAGGGEFAFVVLASAEKLGLIPADLNGVLTTIVLISMAVTPLLGNVADALSEAVLDQDLMPAISSEQPLVGPKAAPDAIVICGYGEVGSSVSRVLMETAVLASEVDALTECVRDPSDGSKPKEKDSPLPSIVCFDLNPSRLPSGRIEDGDTLVMFGDGANGNLVRSTGVTSPRAIIVTYQEPKRRLAATQRLHAFFPDAPIYTRASDREERDELVANGASETITENQELAVQLGACLFLDETAFRMKKSSATRLTVWERAVRALRVAVDDEDEPCQALDKLE